MSTREQITACIVWCVVMAAASGTGWGLGYISKYWF